MRRNTALFLSWLFVFAAIVAGENTSAEYVGGSICAQCHKTQEIAWGGSHHDLAMQEANEDTVLGDFNDASITQYGATSTFYKKNGKFLVRTEGADGKLHDYTVKYTFGIKPLQQYLIGFPGGRYQALSFAWDTRPSSEGGQRWFHLYPDEKITHDDELHWTGINQNWNGMCAECHSTRLEKNYDVDSRTFATTWSEIDVSCEACHGPGADHVAWAAQPSDSKKQDASMGLALQLDERKGVSWTINPETGNPTRNRPRTTDKEVEMCARCHSRRSPISRDYVHGEPLLDHYLPRLLDVDIYHADGQIDDEVYVYGSFVQSSMYRGGVTCSDCHEPHSLQLRAPGNGVCLQCHAATKYESARHHFHTPGSEGSSCAECHMPTKTYMVVDPRHDHSIRIPRPDLSAKLGIPNACTNCHAEETAEWATKHVKEWYGKALGGYQRFATAFAAARSRDPAAGRALAALVRDTTTPDIARATALAGLGAYLGPTTIGVIAQGLSDDDPSVRVAGLRSLEFAPVELRLQLAVAALDDPVRAVRINAARLLAPVRAGDLPTDQQSLLQKGLQEYIEAQQVMAERPEAQINLGNLHAARGETAQAIEAYQTALELNPAFIPAYVNLADLHRSRGDEVEVEKVLRHASKLGLNSGDVRYALGLSLLRQKRSSEAIDELERAARLSPLNARYVYVYAVALNSTGNTEQAIAVLRRAHDRFSNNTDILGALIAFHRDDGNLEAARSYNAKLRSLLSKRH